MTRAQVNRIGAIVPLICSAVAFAIVMANILSGARPQPDENASAHLWQLLMAGQIPFIALFAATTNWRQFRGAALLLALQALAIAAAVFPVWIAGY